MHFKQLSNIITLGIIISLFACVASADSNNTPGGSSNDTAISEKKPAYDSFFSGNNICFSAVLVVQIIPFVSYFVLLQGINFFATFSNMTQLLKRQKIFSNFQRR